MAQDGHVRGPLAPARLRRLGAGGAGTGRLAGQAGLWFPEGWPEPEIHWLLVADATGRGLATEAARRFRDHARDDLRWETVVSCIDPVNAVSVRVAERLGATPEGETRVGERRFVVHRHDMRR